MTSAKEAARARIQTNANGRSSGKRPRGSSGKQAYAKVNPSADQRSGSARWLLPHDSPRDGHAVKRGDAVGHSGNRAAVDRSGSDRGKSEAAATDNGASQNASAASAKSAGVQDDSNSVDDTVSAKGAEAVAVDEDQAGKAEKEHSSEKSGAATDQQIMARIAGKNGAIRAEGGNQAITRSGEHVTDATE